MNRISIQPTQTVKMSSISSFAINNINVNLFNGAQCNVCLFDTSNSFLQNINVTISTDEYSKWGSDDNYMINLIASKLGFQLSDSSNNNNTSVNTLLSNVGVSGVFVPPPLTSTTTPLSTTSQ